ILYPMQLGRYKRELQALRAYAAKGQEQARQAADTIFGLENSLKAVTGEYNGMDKTLFDKKQKEETALRSKVAADVEWRREYADAWDTIANTVKKEAELTKIQQYRSISTVSGLARIARQIVVYATEI